MNNHRNEITGESANCPESYAAIRLLAEVTYTTDQHGIGVEQLHKQEPFNQIPYLTFVKWSVHHSWFKKRQQYFERLKKRIGDQIASRIVQTRVKQLRMVDEMTEQVSIRLTPEKFDELVEGSPASLIGAFCRLVKLSDDLREKVADKMVPDQFSDDLEPGMQKPRLKAQVTTAEAREMALMLIRQRRQQTRGQLSAPVPAEPTSAVEGGGGDGRAVD